MTFQNNSFGFANFTPSRESANAWATPKLPKIILEDAYTAKASSDTTNGMIINTINKPEYPDILYYELVCITPNLNSKDPILGVGLYPNGKAITSQTILGNDSATSSIALYNNGLILNKAVALSTSTTFSDVSIIMFAIKRNPSVNTCIWIGVNGKWILKDPTIVTDSPLLTVPENISFNQAVMMFGKLKDAKVIIPASCYYTPPTGYYAGW